MIFFINQYNFSADNIVHFRIVLLILSLEDSSDFLQNLFYMLIIILFLITGISLSLSIRRISILLKMNEKILTLTIYLFIFMLAISTGLDNKIVVSLDTIGWLAFMMILGVFTAITIVFWFLYNYFSKNIRRTSSSEVR